MLPFRGKLRIALISEHASPLAVAGGVDSGGQNVYVNHVGRCLARRGHQVDVFTRRDSTLLTPVVHVRPRLRVLHVPAGPEQLVPKERLLPFMPEFARNVETSARAGAYDIAHANFFMSGVVALRLRRAFDVPFVITMHALGLVRRQHQGVADGFPEDRIAIERELVRSADRVIAACPQDQHDLLTLYDAVPRKLATVPCGYDPEEFGPCDRGRARSALGLRDDEFVVLQLGRLVPRKGVDDVIRAMAPLVQRHGVNARLLVVGGEADTPCEAATPEIARLRQIAAAAGIADRVVFTGRRRREDLRAFYNAADAFVTVPWYEPFGITPLEAMACGTPVVGSQVGGIKYSVVDNVTGFLVPPHDPDALALRLSTLADNPALGRAMGRAGMHRARSMFTWERVVDQLVDVYAEATYVREHSQHGRFNRRPSVPRLLAQTQRTEASQ